MKTLSEFIKESMVLEMARVGYLDSELEIYVHTNDPGNIPHFHVRDVETRGSKFHTCIEIKTNKYFHHTGKEDVLNSHQRKELHKFLKSKDKYGEENWIVLIKEWNRNNSDMEIDIKQKMPDYKNLKS